MIMGGTYCVHVVASVLRGVGSRTSLDPFWISSERPAHLCSISIASYVGLSYVGFNRTVPR